jgi:hypothetical protein
LSSEGVFLSKKRNTRPVLQFYVKGDFLWAETGRSLFTYQLIVMLDIIIADSLSSVMPAALLASVVPKMLTL